MQTKCYKEDQGLDFGRWTDQLSRYLYQVSTMAILNKINIPKTVADFGGANGNLKTLIPHAVTIDIDPTKNPDIVDNIIFHKKRYELVIIRYVLHYLNDYEVLELFRNINAERVLIIQFVNNDLKGKYKNSLNEHKYFRTAQQLENLLPENNVLFKSDYEVNETFYENRLGPGNYTKHKETLKAYLINGN